MPDLYQHDQHKFGDAGIQLRTPPDLIPPNQYGLLTNAIPLIEGRLEARAGLQFIVNMAQQTSPGSGLHSLTRLNQSAISAVGDRIAGVDTTVQTLALPLGNFPVTRDTQRSGDPLSLPTFHFEADPAAWQLLADHAGMRKYRGGTGTGYYEALGIIPPSRSLASGGIIGAAASAVAAGTGNLSGGATAGNVLARPTTLLNGWGNNAHVGAYELGVDQGFGFGLNGPASPYANPGNAFDGDEATAASIVLLHTHTYAGCVWSFSTTSSSVVGLQLNILSEVPAPGGFGIPPSGWLRSAGIWYSLDGGTTWTEVYNQSQRTKQWDNIPLPSGQNLNQIQVMAFTDAHDDMAHNVFEINIAPSVTPGPGYDWVYTYVNTITQSESNPSITNWGNQFEQTFPQTITTPDPNFGGNAAQSTTGGGGTSPVGAVLQASSANNGRQSVLFSNWTAVTQQYAALYFEIQMSAVVSGGSAGGCAYWAIYFTRDAGITWNLVLDGNTSVDYGATDLQPSFLLFLNPAQDLTKLQLRAVVMGIGDVAHPQNVTARRIRDQAGNLNFPLLVPGGGDRQVTLTITNIKTTGVFLTATPNTLSLASQQADVTVYNPFDPQVDAIRLYRRGGTVTASWAFVKQVPVTAHDGSAAVIRDNVSDTNLASFVTLTNDAPVTSVYAQNRILPYLWGPAFDPPRTFGAGDPDRPGAVYFCNPGNTDQWDPDNFIDVSSPSDPTVTGTIFNTRNFVFSHERMFEITQSLVAGGSFVPFETPCRRGLISPWGLVTTARAIYFIAKDGIYATTGGEEQSLVENNLKPLFPTLDGQGQGVGVPEIGYEAVDLERIEDLRLRYHNDELYFIYRAITSGLLRMFAYDQNKNRWRAVEFPVDSDPTLTLGVTTVYSEEAAVFTGTHSMLILGDQLGSLYTTAINEPDVWQQAPPGGAMTTSPVQVTILTGAYDQGLPHNLKQYANAVFDIDPGGATVANPVLISAFLDGQVSNQQFNITGTGRQKIAVFFGPPDLFGYNIEFFISFISNDVIHPVLYQFDVLWKPEPVSVTHWETRESSYGIPGYLHVRDAYICLRSTTDVLLTVVIDNNFAMAQVYTIPSTNGLREKVYLPFQSNKGRLYHFSFDSPGNDQGVEVPPFQIYDQDCELRVKPFVTSLGYQVIRAWGAESLLATQAYESQLLGGGR